MPAGQRGSGAGGQEALLDDAGLVLGPEGLMMAGVPLAQIAREVGQVVKDITREVRKALEEK